MRSINGINTTVPYKLLQSHYVGVMTKAEHMPVLHVCDREFLAYRRASKAAKTPETDWSGSASQTVHKRETG